MSAPLSADEVAARLAPQCQLSTLECLARLASYRVNVATHGVRSPWFFNQADKQWLLDHGHLEQRGHIYSLTEKGMNTARFLTNTLELMK